MTGHATCHAPVTRDVTPDVTRLSLAQPTPHHTYKELGLGMHGQLGGARACMRRGQRRLAVAR